MAYIWLERSSDGEHQGRLSNSYSGWKKKIFLVAEMKKLFHELVGPIQAVVVVAAGENAEGSSGLMETSINLYSALLSRDLYILTVAALMASASGVKNGQPWPWSKGSDGSRIAAGIFASGDGWCVNHDRLEERTARQGISTAILSGLVAYFLSLPNLLSSLSPYEDLPRAFQVFSKDRVCEI